MNNSQPANQISLAELIAERQEQLNKTDEQIAEALGFQTTAMFEFIKQGKAKLPISNLMTLSEELAVDPSYFFRVVMREYAPETLEVVERLFQVNLLTSSEQKIIDSVRYLSKEKDVTPMVVDGNSIIALVVA